jgi:hypothetical protein
LLKTDPDLASSPPDFFPFNARFATKLGVPGAVFVALELAGVIEFEVGAGG